MESIFDTNKPLDLLGLKSDLSQGEMTGTRSTMARLLASELFLDGRYAETAEVIASTIGWFFDACSDYRRDAVRYDERTTGSRKDWLAFATPRTDATSTKKSGSIIKSLQELLPGSWTVVMVCTIPADESEFVLMENQLNVLEQNTRSGVGTAVLARVNKTGPAVLMPLRKPLDSNCPKHATIPVNPWSDSVDCEHCWNGYKDLAGITAVLKDSTSKNKEDNNGNGKSQDWVQKAQDGAKMLVKKMKWAWLHDGAASLLRGVPLWCDGTKEYKALHDATMTKLKALWKKLAPKVELCEEAVFCITHFLIELSCLEQPSRDDGLVMAIRDVLLSYHCDSFTDGECYDLANKIENELSSSDWKEASAVRLTSSEVERGPVLLVLDKDYVALPWETLPDLNGRSVCRVPSVNYLIDRLKKRQSSKKSASLVPGPRLRRDKLFYVLNPGKDLPKTMDRLKPVLAQVPAWQGTVGEEPSSDEIVQALKANDIYAYFGHGDGRQYLRPETLEKLSSEALVMLFGCGSCNLQPESQLMEPTGVAYSYLQVGCSGVMGMLYVVTDRDCDDMAKYVLKEFLGVAENSVGQPPDVDFAQVVARCRRVCSRRYNAHAPVFYGLPDIKVADHE